MHTLSAAQSEKKWRAVGGLDFARAEYKCHKYIAICYVGFLAQAPSQAKKGRARWFIILNPGI